MCLPVIFFQSKFEDYEDDGYKEFKDKFYKSFIGSRQQDNKEESTTEDGADQGYIHIGKDNHGDNNSNNFHGNNFHSNEDKDDKSEEEKRLNRLYEELKLQTRKESAKIAAELRKKDRIENIKKELLDMLNSIQDHATFNYDGEKFYLTKADQPGYIYTGKDHNQQRPALDKLATRLDTMENLIKELREDETRKTQQKYSYDSRRMNKEVSNKADTLSKTNDVIHELHDNNKGDNNLRDAVNALMDELQMRMKSDSGNNKMPVVASSEKRMENELDEIATKSRHSRLQKDSLSGEEMRKAIDGFNQDARAKRKIQKADRP